eukprot:CAMPEP_0197499436 /NCGR_PEP_ID=MMETSP1311-20131121/61022_1 /TAXON_ID=464262 /ORGANISM="Genus nov. species nov., Strain RCC856" /LENGTH=263 /DNA_ID=CAMNT_0043045181 /DNA_START=53 /DNA_END=846 /DNA_ORIENTATION=-
MSQASTTASSRAAGLRTAHCAARRGVAPAAARPSLRQCSKAVTARRSANVAVKANVAEKFDVESLFTTESVLFSSLMVALANPAAALADEVAEVVTEGTASEAVVEAAAPAHLFFPTPCFLLPVFRLLSSPSSFSRFCCCCDLTSIELIELNSLDGTALNVELGKKVAEVVTEGTASEAVVEAAAPVVEAAKEVAASVPEEAAEANPVAKFAVLFAPLILYTLWTVFRTINRDAKIGDFVFGVVALIVLGNLFSILVFKQRLF